MSLVTVTVW